MGEAVTLRRRVVPRRQAGAVLGVNAELVAAGYLHGFWVDDGMQSLRWWRSIAEQFGAELERRVLASMPGTRPGWRYAVGDIPPVPLLRVPDESHMASRQYLDIEGVRFWHCGPEYGFQRCQAEYLRELGVVDGREWARFKAWRRRGLPYEYESLGGSVGGWIHHLCKGA
ncbi:MAG: hypothetical protein ACKPB4_11490 [Sphaerospermopsis kisseleviana]